MLMSKTNSTPQTTPQHLIEVDKFPFEFLSAIAERESWRKDIHRPIYHVHKWWAKRLGSIFRGIILGCVLTPDDDLEKRFYQKSDLSGVVVFDPFMGSGTTVGEAQKLGCTALGRDINPIACESVRVALGPLNREKIQCEYERLAEFVGKRIQSIYQSVDNNNQVCDVLYFFWVKQVPCLQCSSSVDLFSTRIIARNAYPSRKPEVQICCPGCGDIFTGLHTDEIAKCCTCHLKFNPNAGTTIGTKATCSVCGYSFSVASAVRIIGNPIVHRLYAKLLLTPNGDKIYLPADSVDITNYEDCARILAQELADGNIRLPDTALADGFNTRQAIKYNYKQWRDFFNNRQLLALGWLQTAIAKISDIETRDAFLAIFSGALEFNNLFASYKGEGTGAVRPLFSHHILKPERTPIEANVWGTPKSSGSFSNLYRNRLVRALNYRDAPYEVTINGSGKHHAASLPIVGYSSSSWPVEDKLVDGTCYLSCGSSDDTKLPDQFVDLVVTDPPFFDNVHYSELADFFYSWQKLCRRGFIDAATTTRHINEVQDTNADRFSEKLESVFTECLRVLKPEGLLVFTYHHSRKEGWSSLLSAVVSSGFSIVNAHPVKSEMSVATPKAQAKEPIQIDVIIVCRKKEYDSRRVNNASEALSTASCQADNKRKRLVSTGLKLSRNDERVLIFSQFIAALGPHDTPKAAVSALIEAQKDLEAIMSELSVNSRLETIEK